MVAINRVMLPVVIHLLLSPNGYEVNIQYIGLQACMNVFTLSLGAFNVICPVVGAFLYCHHNKRHRPYLVLMHI